MDREELQGVIGHEMAHIRNCDTRLTTMVTAMFGGFGVFSGRFISILLSREREYLADASAVELTRNPKALIRALEHILKTESPLRCATPGTAQLFIVDPFERADSGRSYNEFINEVTRIRSQPAKTEEQRDEEARNFAAHEYPRNMIVQAVSSHPPLRDRIARLQALIGAVSIATPVSGMTNDQLKAKFRESAKFVQNEASTNPEVLAKVMQSALLALPAGRRLLQEQIGVTPGSASRDPLEQKLYEANLESTGDLQAARGPAPNPFDAVMSAITGNMNLDADSSLPTTGISAPDPAAQEELQRVALAKMLAPVAASMRPNKAVTRPAAVDRPTGSRGTYLFWIVIALSAGAIVASIAAR
jgi:hypothetical protein